MLPTKRMTPTRWLLTIVSFAATIGVSLYMISGWSQQGASLLLPASAHLLAFSAVVVEVLARSLKLRWSAARRAFTLPLLTALRTSLGGDFAAAITPARSGAEPARFLVLRESGLRSSNVLVILYAELFLEVFSLAAVVLAVAVVFRHAGVVLATLVSLVGSYAAVILGIGALAIFLSRRNTHGTPPPWARRLRLTGGRWRTIETALVKLRATIDSVEKVDITAGGLRLPRLGRARGNPPLRATRARAHERTRRRPRATRALAPRLPLRRRGRPRTRRRRCRRDGLPRRPRQRDPRPPLRRSPHLVALLHLLHLHPPRRARGRQHGDASGAEDGGIRE